MKRINVASQHVSFLLLHSAFLSVLVPSHASFVQPPPPFLGRRRRSPPQPRPFCNSKRSTPSFSRLCNSRPGNGADDNNDENVFRDDDETRRIQTIFDEMTNNIKTNDASSSFNPLGGSGGDRRRRRLEEQMKSLYNDEELQTVLSTHLTLMQQLEEEEDDEGGFTNGDNNVGENSAFSLHDMIQQAIADEVPPSSLVAEEPNGSDTNEPFVINGSPPPSFTTEEPPNGSDTQEPFLINGSSSRSTIPGIDSGVMDDSTISKITKIRAIASDVDGTLLRANQTLHPRTLSAVTRALHHASDSSHPLQYFFPATGKTRWGAIHSLGIELATLLQNAPGVFIQGLYCVDDTGTVVFERKLTPEAVVAAEELAQHEGIAIVGYDGDELYAMEDTQTIKNIHEVYGEPMPRIGVTSSSSSSYDGDDTIPAKLSDHDPGFHKLLFMDDDIETLRRVRPLLEELSQTCDACVTQALPTMLEWLPSGCSKATGVRKLCDALKIDPHEELLALGDAENDAAMLEMASIGVAMGNACSMARDAADFVVKATNDEGGAGVAIELFGLGE